MLLGNCILLEDSKKRAGVIGDNPRQPNISQQRFAIAHRSLDVDLAHAVMLQGVKRANEMAGVGNGKLAALGKA